jgi:hypothetical protein
VIATGRPNLGMTLEVHAVIRTRYKIDYGTPSRAVSVGDPRVVPGF